MDRDEAEKITNDPELLASKLYIAQGNSIYPYEELGEASKELFRPLARYVIELLAALTAQGQERPDGPGEYTWTGRVKIIESVNPRYFGDANPKPYLLAFVGEDDTAISPEAMAGTWRKVK